MLTNAGEMRMASEFEKLVLNSSLARGLRYKEMVLEDLGEINRPGIGKLLEYLETSDFFTAPASTKFHRAYGGGLCEHSSNVEDLFAKRNGAMGKPINDESVVICGYLHDACKIGYYEKAGNSYKSVKGHPAGSAHAKLSIEIIEKFIELHAIERELILYHMNLFGCYGYCVEYTPKDLYSAIARNPSVQVFAACDMEESKWMD